MPGTPLSPRDRDDIAELLRQAPDTSWARIGREVDRHPTTIAREVKGNGGRHGYRPASADRKAVLARRRPRACMWRVEGTVRERITKELRQGRSPVAIWADLVADRIDGVLCVETMYQGVYSGTLGVKATECLRTRRPRRRSRQARRPNKPAGLPNIASRPDEVNARTEPGHWEIDQIIGAHNQSSMLTLTERLTRYAIGITMPEGYDRIATLAGLCEALDWIPSHLLKSVTFDQGSEWAEWETLKGKGLPRGGVTSDLWCREVLLEGCSPCPSPIPVSSART